MLVFLVQSCGVSRFLQEAALVTKFAISWARRETLVSGELKSLSVRGRRVDEKQN